MSKLLTTVRQAMKAVTSMNNLERLAKPLEIVEACEKTGRLKFEFTVDKSQTNINNTLHGAYIAFLVDHTTSFSLVMAGKTSNPGVSVDMNMSYMRSAKIGEVVFIESEIMKIGSNLAFLEATLTNSDGKLVATARHTKFVGTIEH